MGGDKVAGNATWLVSPATNSFTNGANWDTGSVPTDTASFGASIGTMIVINSDHGGIPGIGTLHFLAGAPAYSFLVQNFFFPRGLEINGSGFIYDSGAAPATVQLNSCSIFVSSSGAASIGNVTGSGSVIMAGTGTLTLTGNNTFTGQLDVRSGTAQIASGASLSAALINVSGGTFDLNVNGLSVGDVNITSGTLLVDGVSATAGTLSGTGSVTLSGGTLITNTASNSTLQSIVSGSGSLAKKGAGTLTLAAANTYTGGTTVSGGLIKFASAGNLGTGAITFEGGGLQWANGNTFDISSRLAPLGAGGGTFDGNGNNLSFATALTGAGGITKAGAGTLTLAAANSYAGGTTLSGGTLVVSADATLGAAAGGLTFSGGTLETTASFATSRNVTLFVNSGNTWQTDAGTILTLNGNIAGTGGLTKAGAGTLKFLGSGFAGALTVNAGTFQFAGSNQSLGGLSGTGTVVLANGPLSVNMVDGSQFDGTVTGIGGLTKQGLGTLTLTGHNDYAGGTTVSAGTLKGNTFALQGNIVNNAAVVFNQSIINAYAGNMSGTGALSVNGGATGTVILTGNNSYSGITTIQVGTLRVGNGGTMGTLGTGNIVDNDELAFDRSDALTIGAAISGTGGVSQIGNGTTTLTGANSYTGSTSVSVGTLRLGSGGSLLSATGAVTVNGGTLDLNGNSQTVGVLSGTGGFIALGSATLTTNSAASSTLQSIISGSGSLVKKAGGILTLTSTNAYTGGTIVSGGLINFAAANNFGSGAITLDGGGLQWATGNTGDISSRLAPPGAGGSTFDTNGNNLSFATALTGAGGITKTGTGTLTLAVANTYSGGTTLAGGTLAVSADADLGSATGAVTFNGGALETTASFATSRNAMLNGSSTFQTDAGTTLTWNGNVAGTGGLTKAGTGALKFFGGGLAGALAVNAGTFQFSGSNQTVGGLSGTGTVALSGGSLTVNLTSDSTFDGSVTGSGGLIKQGIGTLTLTGHNDYSGGTTVSAGTLKGNTFALQGNIINNAAVAFNQSVINAYAGNMSGTGTLDSDSGTTGTIIVTGNNSYSGVTTIRRGTLQVGNGGTTGTLGTGGVIDKGLLAFDRSDALTIGVGISGAGAVSQMGNGTTTLTAANTYTGSTTVSAGVLRLGAGGSLAAGAALVLSGSSVSAATFDVGVQSLTIGSLSGTGGTIALGGGMLSAVSTLSIGAPMRLLGFGTVQSVVDGAGALVSAGGLLEFQTAVDPTTASAIRVGLAAGSVLKFDSAVGTSSVHPTITFLGGTSLLDLSSTTLPSFHGVLSGFAVGEGIKVANANSASLDGSGTVLTIFNAAHSALGTLTFTNSYSGSAFVVTANTVSLSVNTVDYSPASGGVYVDLAAQFTEHAPAGQGWSGGPGSVVPVSTDHFSGIQNVIASGWDDLLVGGTQSGMLSALAGNDLLYGNTSQVTADNASQLTLDGGAGNNALYGSSGFNTFMAGDANGGFNQIWGAASQMASVSGFTNNTLSFAATPSGMSVYVDLLTGHNAYVNSGPQNNGSYMLEDSISNVPNVLGSSGGDVVIADAGIDRLQGAAGGDQLYAGSGFDTFVYASQGDSNLVSGYDTLYGFKTGTDKIDLSALHSDASHLLIQTSGTANSVYLEATPGSFNPSTDLALNVYATTTGGLHASDFSF
jgi:autotransporter-associated beta strand protein